MEVPVEGVVFGPYFQILDSKDKKISRETSTTGSIMLQLTLHPNGTPCWKPLQSQQTQTEAQGQLLKVQLLFIKHRHQDGRRDVTSRDY